MGTSGGHWTAPASTIPQSGLTRRRWCFLLELGNDKRSRSNWNGYRTQIAGHGSIWRSNTHTNMHTHRQTNWLTLTVCRFIQTEFYSTLLSILATSTVGCDIALMMIPLMSPHAHTPLEKPEQRTHLLPWVAFDLRKLELGVVGIHFADLLARRCAQHFDDLHQLIDARIAREYRLSEQQFGQHTAGTPDIWFGWNVCCVKNGCNIQLVQPILRCTHRSWSYSWWRRKSAPERGNSANRCTTRSAHRATAVWHYRSRTASGWRFPDRAANSVAWCHDGRCPSDGCTLNCGTAGTCRAVGNRKARKTLGIGFVVMKKYGMTYPDKVDGYRLLALGILSGDFVHGFRDVFEHKVQIHFVFLRS